MAFSWPIELLIRVAQDAVGPLAGVAQQPVEALAVAPVDPLLELCVDVQRHLRVGVADLAHHPLDVEVVGEQSDRGAAQGVRRGRR